MYIRFINKLRFCSVAHNRILSDIYRIDTCLDIALPRNNNDGPDRASTARPCGGVVWRATREVAAIPAGDSRAASPGATAEGVERKECPRHWRARAKRSEVRSPPTPATVRRLE